MALLEFQNNPLVLNLALFAAAAVVIWLAGTRIAGYADVLSERTGIGKAFIGLLLLALATQMPEIGTTVSASLANNADLALNNIFGGVTLQTTILVVVDIALVRGALTFFSPKPVLIMQAALLILLLGLTLAAVSAGEFFAIFGIGFWSFLLFLLYVAALFISNRYEKVSRWVAEDSPSEQEQQDVITRPKNRRVQEKLQTRSTRWLVTFFVAGMSVILVAGFVLARLGEVLAEQTGLGASFIGATLLAASTSLPELSTSLSAVRLGNYEMAFSNIFGSNSIMMLLLFIADVFYREGPILNQVSSTSAFIAATGIVVTIIYLIGMLERRNQTFFRLGYDSIAVLGVYLVSLVVLYQLR